MNPSKLSDLLDPQDPVAVFGEAQILLKELFPSEELGPVAQSYWDTVDLYKGRFPGYQACSTEYHDLHHATDTFLTLTRLLHGAFHNGQRFDARAILISLTAALFHDAGYLKEEGDTEGTGAKHAARHVPRSAAILDAYGRQRGFAQTERADGMAMIDGTDLAKDPSTGRFSSPDAALLGQMLMAADLLSQMADRTYLEKLLFLYYEFQEAGIGGFENEVDLLKKTADFYEAIFRRLDPVASRVDLYLQTHFALRWNVQANFYQEAIDRQRRFLKQILDKEDVDPREYLKREGIVERVRERYGPAAL